MLYAANTTMSRLELIDIDLRDLTGRTDHPPLIQFFLASVDPSTALFPTAALPHLSHLHIRSCKDEPISPKFSAALCSFLAAYALPLTAFELDSAMRTNYNAAPHMPLPSYDDRFSFTSALLRCSRLTRLCADCSLLVLPDELAQAAVFHTHFLPRSCSHWRV